MRIAARAVGAKAPVGQEAMQAISSHMTHGFCVASIRGPGLRPAKAGPLILIACAGQVVAHSAQPSQACTKRLGSIAPGGRTQLIARATDGVVGTAESSRRHRPNKSARRSSLSRSLLKTLSRRNWFGATWDSDQEKECILSTRACRIKLSSLRASRYLPRCRPLTDLRQGAPNQARRHRRRADA